MHKISVVNFNKRIDVLISKTKYIIGNDYDNKDLIKKTMIYYFSKLNLSEYAEDTYGKSYVLFDDSLLNISDFDFYYINPNFDMDSDIKLTSKSLCLSYINSLLDNIEYNETFQTISVLMNDLLENVFDVKNEIIVPNVNVDFTKKTLIKLISLYFMKDDNQINNYDLSLKERIILQLKMIASISKKSNKNIIILGEIPIIDKEIIEILDEINSYNLIFIENSKERDDIDLYIMNQNEIIDLQNDELIFELCNNSQNYYDIKGMKEKVYSDYLNKIFIK